MTDPGRPEYGDLSMFVVGATLLRARWRIVRWTMAGAVLAALTVVGNPSLYRASASFAPQGGDAGRSGLANIAGQFGVALPSSGQALSPEYYARLLRSRTLLRRIVRDTFVVAELGNRRVPFVTLFKLNTLDPLRREDDGVLLLQQLVSASVVKTTGIVELSAATRWRSVSLAITDSLVAGVNDFNQRSRQEQASNERRFVEGRLAIANTELRRSEDRLESFLQANRQFNSSPELVLQRDRLQRDVGQRQQVYTTLAQSYEEVRVREVRDTPVITVIEPPSAPALPEPRGRSKVILLGIMLGGFLGVCLVLASDMMERRRRAGDVTASEFSNAFATMRDDFVRPYRWAMGRLRRSPG